MSTLVPTPEPIMPSTSNLQPIGRPESEGLGSFLNNLLPAVKQGIDTYQEDNAAHLRALGQNDVLNDKFSEVSFLGRKAYAEGRTFQTVINGRAALTKDFNDKVNASDDPEEWQQYIKEYSDATIQNIKESDLPNATKAKLYESQLTNNATYMASIEKRTIKVTQDLAYESRTMESATLLDDFEKIPMNAEETLLALTSFTERGWERFQNAYPEKSREDFEKENTADVLAVFDVLFEGIKSKPDQDSMARINLFTGVMDELPFLSMEAAQKWKKKAVEFTKEFDDDQYTMYMTAVQHLSASARLDPNSVTEADINDAYDTMLKNETFTPSQRLQITKTLDDIHYNQQVALHKGSGIPNATDMSLTDAKLSDNTPTEVLNQAEKDMIKEYGTTAAGFAMIQKYGMGAEFWEEGVKRGAKLAVGTFLPYINLTDGDVKESEYDGLHRESYDTFKQMYQEAAAGNGTLANLMLADIPSEQREAFITGIQGDYSLEWVRNRLKNPVTTKAEYGALKDGIGKLNAEHFGIGGLGNYVFGNTNNMDTPAQEAYVLRKRMIAESSMPDLVTKVSTGDPRQIAIELEKYEFPSTSGYSNIMANSRASRKVRALSRQGSTPISTEYVSEAADFVRKRDAKARDLRAYDSVAYFDDTGDYLMVDYYHKDGFGGDGSKKDTLRYSTADIINHAQQLYSKDKQRRTKPTPAQQATQEAVRVVGKVTLTDKSTGRPNALPITGAMSRNFGQNANVAKAVLDDIGYWYGSTTAPVKQPEGGVAIGLGYNTEDLPEWANRIFADAVSSSKGATDAERTKKIMAAQTEVMTRQLKEVPFGASLRAVGIPMPTQDLYPRQHQDTLKLMYTTAVLHGKDGLEGNKSKGVVGVNQLLTAPNKKKASELFSKTKLFSKTNFKRNKYYWDIINKYYTQRGK